MSGWNRPSETFPGQCLHLHRDNLKNAVRDTLCGGLDTLQEEVARRGRWHFFETKKLIGRDTQRLSDPNECGEVRLPIPADIMRIAPLVETATPRGLCVGDTQFLRSISQIPTKRIHENVLFWKNGTRHELIGVRGKPILFLKCGTIRQLEG